MIPVYQTLTTADNGKGNCFAACIASIAELPLRDLPPIDNGLAVGVFWATIEKWLVNRGLFLNRHEAAPKGWSVMGGRLFAGDPAGVLHAVVGFNGQLVHDPYPLPGAFGAVEEYYTIDPIAAEQRPYCEDLLQSRTLEQPE